MLTPAGLSTGGTDTVRKLSTLLLHLEDGLRDASFHLARRELETLVDLLPRQAHVLEAAIALFQAAEMDERAFGALSLRFEEIRKKREILARNVSAALAEIGSELRGLRRASARLQHVRRTAAGRDAAESSGKLHGWA